MTRVRWAASVTLLLLLVGLTGPAYAQVDPEPPSPVPQGGPPETAPSAMQEQTSLTVASVRVLGAEARTRDLVAQTSGLSEGQSIQLPRSEAIAEAIRAIYELRLFSDVRIYQENRTEESVGLVIEVFPEPRGPQ